MVQYRDYPTYLESAHWRDTRAKILVRDKYTCVLCPKPAEHVHHINYRNWYDVYDTDLMSVCEGCHCAIHLAIDAGYVKLNNKGSMVKTIEGLQRFRDRKPLTSKDKKERTHYPLNRELCQSLDHIPVHKQYLIAGVVKRPRPKSFIEWEGKIVSRKVYHRILSLRRSGPQPKTGKGHSKSWRPKKDKNVNRVRYMNAIADQIINGVVLSPKTIAMCKKYAVPLDKKGIQYPRQIILSYIQQSNVPFRDHLAGGESPRPSVHKTVDSVQSRVNCEATPTPCALGQLESSPDNASPVVTPVET